MLILQKYPPRNKLLPLSFGIERAILDNLEALETITDDDIGNATKVAFQMVYPSFDVNQQLPQLVESVIERINALNQEEPPKKSYGTPSKTLGTAYAEWVAMLDAERLCLYLAGWDPTKALQYYWEVESITLQEAIKLKAQHDSQLSLLQMEASLYGFGGKYKDDNSGEKANVHDLSTDEGIAALKSFGF